MLRKIALVFNILLCFFVNAQITIKKIDSLNNLSFDIILKNTINSFKTYKTNAQNAKLINYKLGEAKSYANLSIVSFFNGNLDDCYKYHYDAIKIFEEINAYEELSYQYGEIGFRLSKRDFNKALYFMRKGMKIAEEKKFTKPLLSIYNNYGYLKFLEKDIDSAIYFYNKGLKLKEKVKDSVGLPFSYNNLGEAYLHKKDFKKAENYFNQAFIIRKKNKDLYGIADNYAYFGDLLFEKKDYNTALINFKKSLSISIKENYNNLLRHNYNMISQSYEKLNYTDSAYYYFKEYTKFKDSLLIITSEEKIAQYEVAFETQKKEKEILQKNAEMKQKNLWLLILSLSIGLVGLFAYYFFKQLQLKSKQKEQEYLLKSSLQEIEKQNELQEQRISISRDLHDNIGSQLTFIISSIDNLKFFKLNQEKLNEKYDFISLFTQQTITELRDTIWAMNKNTISIIDLQTRIINFIDKAKLSTQTQFTFNTSNNVSNNLEFTSVNGINIYRIIQEGVNNAIKYANATLVEVYINQPENLQIIIKDNGKGFNLETTEKGNGLNNIKKRTEMLKGTLEIISNENEGTLITVNIPIY